MAGDDCVVVIEQHRIRKAKFGDAICNLADLIFCMSSGISGIVLQVADWLLGD